MSLRHLLLITLLVLLSPAGAAVDARELVHGQGRLWQVRAEPGGASSHVFATLHSDEPAVLDLPLHVKRAFARSERFAFELDFERDVDAQMRRAMIDRDPPTLRRQLTAAEWRLARRAAAEHGIPARMASRLEPWALALTVTLPRADPANSLDRVLFARAQARGAPITALETIEEQIAVYDAMEIGDQLALLRVVLDLYREDALAPMFDRIRDEWLRGDLAAIMQIIRRHLAVADNSADEILFDRLLDQRNRRMAQRMRPLIERGHAFIAVGALHLPGEAGVLRLLEQQGYTVDPVTATGG